MTTITHTHTRTDIRIVFEQFQTDLQMLAVRTHAMELNHAVNCANDVYLMALENCLKEVHIQLLDRYGNLVRAHQYSIVRGKLSNSRPGGNVWPCLPNGILCVVVKYSDIYKGENLEKSGKLNLDWRPSSLSTNYYGMRKDSDRYYSSNGYGLRRDTFVA